MRIHDEPISITHAGQRLTADLALNCRHAPVRSLYIHVPFCFHKCHYCDFYSFVGTQDRQEQFVAALERELEALAPHADADADDGLETIFIGGGTPSLLRPEFWRRLLDALDRHFELRRVRSGGEFTVECNPETVSPELMETLAAGGVNRISVGAQSFNTAHLKALERWHDPANVQRALALADEVGIKRRSVDLIYAIPGQTLADVRTDLASALELDPGVEHISAYCLTYEPNTAMTKRVERGDIEPLDDDLAAEMQTLVYETLRDAGFERYEVSNFARGADAQSLHNLAYWRNEQWLAAGPSASGHVLTTDPETGLPAGARWKNLPRLSDWMARVNAGGFSPVVDYEAPDPVRTLKERIMMGIRLAEGLDGELVLTMAERIDSAEALRVAHAKQVDLRFFQKGRRWRLTERGFLHADGVAGELMRQIRRLSGCEERA